MVSYRNASTEDAPVLLRLIHGAFEEYRGRIDPPSGGPSETIARIRQKLVQSDAIIAQAGVEPVGCVFHQVVEDHVHVSRLAVVPAWRRRGIGRGLVAQVEGIAQSLGYPAVRLGVRIALPLNRAWYEHMGYLVIEYCAHPGYDRPTYVIMEKRI